MADSGEVAAAQERVAELEAQLWQALAAADQREARLERQLKEAQERIGALEAQLETARQPVAEVAARLQAAQVQAAESRLQLDAVTRQAAALSDQLDVAKRRIAEQDHQLGLAAEREAGLKAAIERLKGQQRLAISAHIGEDNNGEVNVAGQNVNVIKASPGELRDCPYCAGEGRFTRMEGPDRVIILCLNCRGLGQVRL